MQTDPTPETAADGGEHTLTPADIRDLRPDDDAVVEDPQATASMFERLLSPRSRVAIIETLLANANEALTAAQIVERSDNVSRSGFDQHKSALLDLDVLLDAGKVGNATVYELNTAHPAVQLLQMLDSVMTYGETPMLLEEQFVGTPGDE